MEVHTRKYIHEKIINPVVETGAYAAGDLLCAKIEIAAKRDVLINKIIVTDLAKQNAELDFIFFDGNPSGTTFTVNTALTIADADAKKITGTFTVSPVHYYDFVNNSVATLQCNDTGLLVANKQKIYCAVVCRGTPTYVATTDIRFRFCYYEA